MSFPPSFYRLLLSESSMQRRKAHKTLLHHLVHTELSEAEIQKCWKGLWWGYWKTDGYREQESEARRVAGVVEKIVKKAEMGEGRSNGITGEEGSNGRRGEEGERGGGEGEEGGEGGEGGEGEEGEDNGKEEELEEEENGVDKEAAEMDKEEHDTIQPAANEPSKTKKTTKERQIQYIQGFWQCITREWETIDRLR